MMTRDEALLFGGILNTLKERLETAQGDLAEAREMWGYTGAGGFVAHIEGRIAELESVITGLKNQYWEDLEHLND